ncbi:MAG: efflux RND transporter periplasmic adaptor subunit [Flavobacteriales bacterium]
MQHGKFFRYIALFLLLTSIYACKDGSQKGGALQERLTRKKAEFQKLRSEIDSIQRRLARSDSGKGKEARKVLVRTKELAPEHFEHSFTVNGAVKADQEVLLSPERQGVIEKILVEEGDRVQKGELIARQRGSVLRTKLSEVRTRYEHARTLYKKQKRLWKDKGIGSELDYLNAKNKMETLREKKRSLQEKLDMTRIKAPITGVVEELRLKEGAFAAPSKPIAHIVGVDELKVVADLSERYLPKVEEGDSVDISFPVLGLHLRRPIRSLGDRIAPQDRTFEARLRIQNTEEHSIKPNLSADLRFTDFRTDSARIIPSGIVQSDPKGDHVYVVTSADTVDKRYIELGVSQNGKSLVRKGLKFGDRVVVAGYGGLSTGTPVREEKAISAHNRKGE